MNPPSVSIILPTLNGACHLRELLPAIATQNYQGDVEIVAIDSESSDDSAALLRSHGALVVSIPQKEFGHGRTRNHGVSLAGGQIVVFLSQDALPVGSDWLRRLVAPLQNETIGATFARQLPRRGATPFERHAAAEIYPARSRLYRLQAGRAIELQKLFFSNVCSAARREICTRFPFDESLIMSEDQFFARDLLLGGYQIHYNASAKVVHSHHYDLRALWKRHFDSGASLHTLGAEKWHRRARFAARFLARELLFVARENPGWLLFWPCYEGTRILALLVGGQAHRFPLKWNRNLGLHRHFWRFDGDETGSKP